MIRALLRALALLAILALTWWLLAAGLWQVAALCLLAALLGGVVARPGKAPRFRPDTWRKEHARVRGA